MPRNLTITTTGTDNAELVDRQILFADGGAADFALTAAVVSSTLETGNTDLQANNDITFSDAVTAASGGHDLVVQAGRAITVSAAVTADGAGAITLVANNTDGGETDAGGAALTGSGTSADRDTGAGHLVVNADIASGSGTIKLVSSGAATNGGVPGNVTLAAGVVSTTGTVVIRAAGGAILQSSGTVSATSLALVAATGVSVSGDSGTLAGSVSAAGAAFTYVEANALTVGTAGGVTGITTNGGTVQLSVGGNLTVAAAIDAGTANVNFFSAVSGLSFINQSSVGSSGGNVASRFDDYDLQAGSSLTVAANREVNLRVATGGVGIGLGSTGPGAAFSQAEIDTITAGQLRFTAAADITVSSAVTLNSAQVATLVLEAVSGILDATASEQTDLTATNLALKMSTGIGAFDDLDTAVSVLAFRNVTSGNVNISNTGALTIGSVFDVTTSTNTATGAGNTTTITASSALTFAVNTTSAGNATYTAGENNDAPAGADDLTINAGVTVSVTAGTLTLQAGDDIVINGQASASGAVTITAAFNDLDGLGGVVNNGLITGDSVDIHAIGDISVGRVSAGTLAGLTTTAGAIIDSNATGADITASSVSLSAATGIGSAGGANAISTEATTLTATNSTSGHINIIEATGVDLAGITNNASGGDVSIATLDGSITTSAAIAATGNIALATAGAGSTLTISNTVTTFSGTVDLTADAMALNPAGITASSVALRNTTAGQAIDLGGADAAGTLGLTSAELNTVIATGGALTIGRNDASASGNITISSAIAPTGAPSLMLRTGGAITQSAGAAVANLALVAGTGVALTNAGNDVANLSGLVTGTGDFSYTDVNAVTVSGHGAVNADTSIGIRTTNGAIALTGTQISLAAGLITDNLGNASNVTLTGPVEVFAASVAIDTDQTAGGNAGNVTFTSTVDGIVAGINTLIVDARETGAGAGAGGTVTFGGAVGSGARLAGLAVAGSGVSFTGTNNVGTLAIALSGAANGVSYTDADALTVGIAGGVTGITTNNGAVTLTAGAITVSAALSTTAAVTLNASGTTTLGVALSGIGSLTTDAAGTTAIDGGAVTTTGAQTYQDAVTLGGTTTLTSTASGNLSFAGTIDGTFGLTVNSSGTTTFGGVLGGTDRLLSVTTDAAGTTAFNMDGSLGVSVGTTGAQTYNDAVTLGASTFLVSDNGGAITLGKTIDGSAGPARALTVTTSGAVTFGGAVGSTLALDALTTNGGGPIAINGGSVTTTNAQSYDAAVTLGAATALTGGSVAFHGTVSNGGFGLTVHTDAGSFDGVVSGGGGLTLASTAPNSAAVATTTLSAANLYTGATTVDSGTLALGGAGSIAGSSQVNLTSASAAFDLSATASGATIVSLNGVANSHVELGARTLTLSGAAHGYAGIIEGTGGLTLAGGTETLSGVNTYVGATAVNGGTLLVDGAIAASILTTVANGGTLGGNGTAGAVTVASGGTLAPGASAGDLAVGNLSLASGATLRIELGGTGAGTGYDQLDVNGTVALGGATLDLSLIGGFTPVVGTRFTIIDNNAADAVSGTFLGLAEGAIVSAGGYAFVVSYLGGDGNDVVLSAAAVGTAGDDNFTAPDGSAFINGGGGTDTITFGFKLTDATVSYVDNTIVIDGPSSRTVLTGFERFVFTDGTVDNADGNPLVDDLFYYAQNHDVWTAHADADFHYGIVGWKEGRDPSAFFDTSIYLSANPDVAASGANPLTHYDTVGWQQGRVPSLTFDTRAYLDANPDVKAAHIDPLLHFLGVGASEGRQPIAPTELATANGFDYVYYLAHNPDVAAAGVDPLWHFQNIGWTEGRDPNAYFDTAGYLGVYTDVAAAHINPLDHFHQSGWQEGRDPSLAFDTDSYLAANPDVAAAHVDPLAHFLHSGHYEGRTAIADAAWG